MADLDRIYDMLQQQGETLARIDQSQRDTHERLFGASGVPGVIPYLHGEVTKHNRQIAFWRGALAIISVLFTAALAWAGSVLGRHQ